jgi:hypothetical protein
MRKSVFTHKALLLLAIASPSLLLAQFQQPTDEELKMTADPKAPGAAAVYLYQEQITDDANHFVSYYDRIKVLTEKGKELATVRIPYEHGVDSVTDIQGRTIHADGTIVPLSVKPSDLMDFKNKNFQVNTVVFTLPSVEVGSILEYRLKVRSPDERVSQPSWDIQSPYLVRKAHYSFHPHTGNRGVINSEGQVLDRLLYSAALAPEKKVDYSSSNDLYSLDLTDVLPLPAEDWMPPLNTLRWRVEFYYSNAFSGPAFWQDAGKHWGKQAQAFTAPSGKLVQAVSVIVTPADPDRLKAMKIYAAVQKLDNTDFSRKKSEVERKKEKLKDIHNAEDVWKRQSGSADDIALLYVAMARAAGLKASPVQVVNRNRAIFDGTYLSTRQLDDYLAVVFIDGKDLYLDPGQKMCPFGALHWKHTLASGFRLNDKETVAVTTPASSYKAALVQRIADLTIDAQGSVTGTIRFVMFGPEAVHWRQVALRNDQDEVKKEFNESMQGYYPDGVQADFDHFLGLDEYEANLIGIVKVSGNLGTATGKHFFLPGLFFESRSKHPFVTEDKRLTPVDVHYPSTEQDEVTYHLPPGFTVESAPQPANPNWPDNALLKIKSQVNGDSVVVLRTLAYNFTLLKSKDYPDLHDFYQKVATADQQQIVLTRSLVAKGN